MLKKQIDWKNAIGVTVLLGTIFCVVVFNVKIGFTIFQNVELMLFNSLIFAFFMVVLVILIIIFVIVIVIYQKKNKMEINE